MQQANLSDCQHLENLHKACFSKYWDYKYFESVLLNQNAVIFLDDFSFIVANAICDEMEILTFCVLPEHRRQGRAKALLHKIIEFAKDKKIKNIFLDVAVDNLSAVAIYFKYNFQLVTIRKNYYTDIEGKKTDALVLKLEI